METFEIEISELATYYQLNTVTVEAETEEHARELVMDGHFDYTGDNEILYDTEDLIQGSTTIKSVTHKN